MPNTSAPTWGRSFFPIQWLDFAAERFVDEVPDGFFIVWGHIVKGNTNAGRLVVLILRSPPGHLRSYMNGFGGSGQGEFQVKWGSFGKGAVTNNKTTSPANMGGKRFVMPASWIRIVDLERGWRTRFSSMVCTECLFHIFKFSGTLRIVNSPI